LLDENDLTFSAGKPEIEIDEISISAKTGINILIFVTS